MPKEAMLYDRKDNLVVECFLCNHHCKIANGQLGICQVRQNLDGTLFTHSYGKVASVNLDPIEKKPFFHMLPGSNSFSIAAIGCNFHCGFCQNWEISQAGEAKRLGIESHDLTPEAVVGRAQECGAAASPAPIPSRLYFLNTLMISPRLRREKAYMSILSPMVI